MIGQLLGELTEKRLTSVNEIARATGRGESTVYRWINGDSRPDYGSIRKLISGLGDAEAKRRLVEHFTSALAIAVIVAEEDEDDSPMARPMDERVRGCIESIDHVAHAVGILLGMADGDGLTSEATDEATAHLNDAARELIACRAYLAKVGQRSERDG